MADTALLLGCGIITAVPLMIYANGAKLLRLSTIGIMQYIAPTIIFLIAVFLFKEPLGTARMIAFPLIWAGLVLYTWSMLKGAASDSAQPHIFEITASSPSRSADASSAALAMIAGIISDTLSITSGWTRWAVWTKPSSVIWRSNSIIGSQKPLMLANTIGFSWRPSCAQVMISMISSSVPMPPGRATNASERSNMVWFAHMHVRGYNQFVELAERVARRLHVDQNSGIIPVT